MDEILKQVLTPFFWFGTVVAGILVSLIANILQRLLDKMVASRRKATADRLTEEAAALHQDIDDLYRHKDFAVFFAAKESRFRWSGIRWCLVSIFFGVSTFFKMLYPLEPGLWLNWSTTLGGTIVAFMAFRVSLRHFYESSRAGVVLDYAFEAERLAIRTRERNEASSASKSTT